MSRPPAPPALPRQMLRTVGGAVLRLSMPCALSVLLGGCAAVGGVVGAVASIATSTATGNAAVALGVGIGVKTITDEAGRYVSRRLRRSEQEAIVAALEGLQPGESAQWQLAHLIGTGSDQGEVRVTRVIDTPLAQCKELLFSMPRGEEAAAAPQWFHTSACREAGRWRWAAVEPAVERWGNLQ